MAGPGEPVGGGAAAKRPNGGAGDLQGRTGGRAPPGPAIASRPGAHSRGNDVPCFGKELWLDGFSLSFLARLHCGRDARDSVEVLRSLFALVSSHEDAQK